MFSTRLTNRSTLASLFLFALAVLPAIGQPARPNFNRTSNYDVQHYVLRVSFDRKAKKVFGDTTVRLKPTVNVLSQIDLDAANLNF
jgi:hypothetical protein